VWSTISDTGHLNLLFRQAYRWQLTGQIYTVSQLELELEIVHNKKEIHYKTIDGKEAQSFYIYIYISPVIAEMKIKFF